MKSAITNETVERIFHEYDIRPTAVRILVWKEIITLDFAFALSDLEGVLPTVDRSTIFRALTLFVEKHLLHTIDDGSGQQKYCICHQYEHHMGHCHCSEGEQGHDEDQGHRHHEHEACQHVHLSCTKCGRTFCLRNQKIPPVQIPEGFQVQHTQYIIQGICPRCAHKSSGDCLCHNT